MDRRFKIVRIDGRSNSQVIIDYVKDGAPGTIYTYDELANALRAGVDRQFERTEVQSIVTSACSRLLKEHSRTLHNVRYKGYRLAPAAYHLTIAHERTSKADRQMQRGVQVLQNVRWNEMDQNQRMAHEGQLIIIGTLCQQMKAFERRQASIESAIRRMQEGTP